MRGEERGEPQGQDWGDPWLGNRSGWKSFGENMLAEWLCPVKNP